MRDFILFMHSDAEHEPAGDDWASYFGRLREAGAFQGGSSIGAGECFRLCGEPGPLHDRLSGYIRLQATDLEAARELVEGNPVLKAGGTVELRELPTEDT